MNLTVRGLCAAYRGKSVLEQVSFAAAPGEITALVGRNGAGKSTLISCLMGEKQDYGGSILLDGQDLRAMPLSERSRALACMPQVLPRPHVTVYELAAFGRAPYLPLSGALSDADRAAVERALAAVGMEAFSKAFVDELSGGERKKAFFAMTLAQDTPVVVLDEPTAHLDAVSRFEFLALLESACKQTGKTVLAVMHDLPDVLRCADHIAVLHEKKIAFWGDAAAFLAEEIPRRCFRVSVSGDAEHGYALRPL